MQSTENRRHPSKWNSVPVPERVAERAYTKIDHIDADGCWISSYSTSTHGYAQIGWSENRKSKMVLAHRASWVHVNGQVPLGMTLDHLCKERKCVNPDHLRLLPNFENARRTHGADWKMGYCRNGHSNEHLVEITRKNKSGGKRIGLECKICMALARKKWEDANQDKIIASRERNKDKQKERSRAWYQANKELSKERARERRRAQKEALAN